MAQLSSGSPLTSSRVDWTFGIRYDENSVVYDGASFYRRNDTAYADAAARGIAPASTGTPPGSTYWAALETGGGTTIADFTVGTEYDADALVISVNRLFQRNATAYPDTAAQDIRPEAAAVVGPPAIVAGSTYWTEISAASTGGIPAPAWAPDGTYARDDVVTHSNRRWVRTVFNPATNPEPTGTTAADRDAWHPLTYSSIRELDTGRLNIRSTAFTGATSSNSPLPDDRIMTRTVDGSLVLRGSPIINTASTGTVGSGNPVSLSGIRVSNTDGRNVDLFSQRTSTTPTVTFHSTTLGGILNGEALRLQGQREIGSVNAGANNPTRGTVDIGLNFTNLTGSATSQAASWVATRAGEALTATLQINENLNLLSTANLDAIDADTPVLTRLASSAVTGPEISITGITVVGTNTQVQYDQIFDDTAFSIVPNRTVIFATTQGAPTVAPVDQTFVPTVINNTNAVVDGVPARTMVFTGTEPNTQWAVGEGLFEVAQAGFALVYVPSLGGFVPSSEGVGGTTVSTAFNPGVVFDDDYRYSDTTGAGVGDYKVQIRTILPTGTGDVGIEVRIRRLLDSRRSMNEGTEFANLVITTANTPFTNDALSDAGLSTTPPTDTTFNQQGELTLDTSAATGDLRLWRAFFETLANNTDNTLNLERFFV